MVLQIPVVLYSGGHYPRGFRTLDPNDTVPGTDTTAQASGNAALVLAGTALASGNAGLVSASNKVPISGGYMTGQLFAASGVVVSGTLSRNGFNVVTVGDVETVTSTMIASGTIIDADVNISGAINATKLRFLQAGASAVARTVESKLKDTVSVKDFGAEGDGATDDTAKIQAAIDSLPNGGVVFFPPGTYRIARTIGTNDRWGLKVTQSNITLKGQQAVLRRFNTGISTYALAYPILMVGTPDSNVAASTQNIIIEGLTFQGENTRHSTAGSTLSDARYSIVFKNTSETIIKGCTFTAIDSSAVFYQQPAAYDYANSQFFNTTKNYRSRITDCSFIATSHAVAGRALLHAISVSGIDYLTIQGNYFEWCDDCVSGDTTYNRSSDIESNTYTRTDGASTLGALKRTGRNIIVDGNTVLNSSEHAFYMSLMDVTVNNNNIRTDDPTICTGDQIKIRSRGAVVTGNIISNYAASIGINEPSFDVIISGNACRSRGITSGGGIIEINSQGLSSYISSREAFYVGGSPDYQVMGNIVVSDNSIDMPDTAAGSATQDIAVRIYSDTSDTNYPDGQMQGITVNNNTIKGYNIGIYCINSLFNNVVISSNAFYAKAFTRASFTSGTTLNTRAVMQTLQNTASLEAMRRVTFTGNHVDGAEYLFATNTGAGTAGTFHPPEGIVGNRFNYIKNIKTADLRAFTGGNMFQGNTGLFFLDRTWSGNALHNSLHDGTVTNSALRYSLQWTGSALRFYTDDAATFITL